MATNQSSQTPGEPEKGKDPYNAPEQLAQEKMEGKHWSSNHDDKGQSVTEGGDTAAESAEAVREGEESPQLPSRDGFYRQTGKKGKEKFQGKVVTKGRGALFAFVSLVFGAGLGLSAFFSPSLLIIHMKEIMTEKFHTSLATTDARSANLLKGKIDNTTAGLCSEVVTLKCRFSTMSEKQVTNFKNAGITVLPETPNAGKRTKPTGYVFKDKTITAVDFAKLSREDPAFRTALRLAYNPKYGGFQGKPWTATATKFDINKTKTRIDGDTREARMASLNETVRNGSSVTGTPKVLADFEAECEGVSGCDAQKNYDAYRAQLDAVDTDGKSGAAGSAIKNALSTQLSGSTTFLNALKITGVADSACQAYGALNLLGYLAKTLRAIQLARYAMVFMKAADELKSGEGMSPETATFLGATLTEITYDIGSTTQRIKRGAATDSLGYKYAAFGDTSSGLLRSDNLASRYLAGGGFTGELIEFTNTVMGFFPGGRDNARQVCGTLANPFVQAGSALVGVASLFVPGANVAKIGMQAAASVLLSAGLMMLPTLLADIVAGTVTDGAVGEESGNAIASGAGNMLSDTLAGQSGNGSMTKADTLAYLNVYDQTLAQYAEDTRLASSPLDPTTRHTFLGGIVASIIPTLNTSTQGAGYLSTVGSLLSTSFSKLIPMTSAQSDAREASALEVCQDQDVIEAGYAADIFCNVIRGIPPQYLNKDINLVIDELIEDGDLYESNDAMSAEYAAFVEQCITTTNPPGYDDLGNYDNAKAQECIVTEDNVNRYLLFVDKRIEEVMSGEEIEEPDPPVGSSGSNGAFTLPLDPGYGISGEFNDPNYEATKPHKGIDLANYPGGSYGKPVYAISSGTVVMSGAGQGCGGNNDTRIQLPSGEIIGYLHMNGADITVRVGDQVTVGQQIGKIASCGQSSGAHLHFEILPGSNQEPWMAALPSVQKYGGTYVDPVAYMAHYGVNLRP